MEVKLFKTVAVVITIAMMITAAFFTRHEVSACTVTNIEYDLDNDGSLTEDDLSILTEQVVYGSSEFNATDMVKLKRLLLETEADESEIYINSENPSEDDIQTVRNALFNSELTSIEYDGESFILKDLLKSTVVKIPEEHIDRTYDEFVADATLDDGKYLEVGIIRGKLRVFRPMCKPAMAYKIDENFEVNEVHTEMLEQLFNEGTIKKSIFKGMIGFDMPDSEVYLEFKNKRMNPDEFEILASNASGEVIYQLVTDGKVYLLCAIA